MYPPRTSPPRPASPPSTSSPSWPRWTPDWRSWLGWDAAILVLAVCALLAPLACRLAQALPDVAPAAATAPAPAAPATPTPPATAEADSRAPDQRQAHEMADMRGMNGSMSHEHMGMGAHMKMTAPRPPSTADRWRADQIVSSLRQALARYRDSRVAIADGYQPFLPQVPQPLYHFTNWQHGFAAAFSFDPERPTSLLYEKTADGYRLKGAMFTMPKAAAEEELNARVPLSVASWHQHVNICLPAPPHVGERKGAADWTRFGFAGSIATAADCAAARGEFHPVIFGWMVHVYPYESDPAQIWAH